MAQLAAFSPGPTPFPLGLCMHTACSGSFRAGNAVRKMSPSGTDKREHLPTRSQSHGGDELALALDGEALVALGVWVGGARVAA